MLTRILNKIKTSAFLLGPRGTGKSTWINKKYKKRALFYDLLDTSEVIRLSREPGLLYKETAHLKTNSYVIIDEIQKVPSLLNEVHRIIEERGIKFILSGSSARKLKSSGVNLLAGRALSHFMFPLVSKEVNFDFSLKRQLTYGMLPSSFLAKKPQKYLKTYAETYLKEEIKEEALVRNIGHFSRFLEIAARQNGEITNTSSIARDAGVARQTVQGYFEILIDTLVGRWLEPWKLKRSTKQISHPKFYFFDPGVVRSLSGRLPYPPMSEEFSGLLETFIINEMRAYLHYNELEYPLFFWRSQSGVEVDLFLEIENGYLAIEIKSNKIWTNKFNRGLNRLSEELGKNKMRCYGIFTGEKQQIAGNVTVLPVIDFLKKLWGNEIIN